MGYNPRRGQHVLSQVCSEKLDTLEKCIQSLIDASYPVAGNMLWDCKVSENGEWQRQHTLAQSTRQPLGQVIGTDKDNQTVTVFIFSPNSNHAIDGLRTSTGHITIHVSWCQCKLESLML